MEILNTLNLTRISGGTKLKQGDFGSVLSYSLADENGQEITSFDTKTAYINLVLDDKILFTTTTQVDISRVTFHIDKALPIGLYYLEIKIDDYIFPSDKDSVILIEEGAIAYDLKDLIPNYDVAMTITTILSDLAQKGMNITNLQTKVNAIYDKALSNNAEIIEARGGKSTLNGRLDGLDIKDTDLQSQINTNKTNLQSQISTNKTNITNTNSRIDNITATAGNGTVPSELTDIRVGDDGVTYTSAGEAIRKQLNNIKKGTFRMFQLKNEDFVQKTINTNSGRLSFGNYAVYYGNSTFKKINSDMLLYKNITGYRTIMYYFKKDLTYISAETLGDTIKTGIYTPNIPVDAYYFALSIGETAWDLSNNIVLSNINIFSRIPLSDFEVPKQHERFEYCSVNPLIADTSLVSSNGWYTLINSNVTTITTSTLVKIRVVWALNGKNVLYEEFLNTSENQKITISKTLPSADVYFSISLQSGELITVSKVAEIIGVDKFSTYENYELIPGDFSLFNLTGPICYRFVENSTRKVLSKPIFFDDHNYKWLSQKDSYAIAINSNDLELSNTTKETTRFIYHPNKFIMLRSSDNFYLTRENRNLLTDFPSIIGHRCFMSEAPENTIEALKKAHENGYRAVETDVKKTSDGVLVIHHDDTLLRMCGVDKKIADITLTELKSYPIISGSHIEDYQNVKIPTVTEFLNAAKMLDIIVFMDGLHLFPIDEVTPIIKGYNVYPRLSGYNASTIYNGITHFLGNELVGQPLSSNYPINIFTSWQGDAIKAEVDKIKKLNLKSTYFLDVGQEKDLAEINKVGFDALIVNKYGKNLI